MDERRILLCRNEGDRDSLLFGNVDLYEQDRYEGWGVSAAWERELSETEGWTTHVNDYSTFEYLRRQEEVLQSSEASLHGLADQSKVIEQELDELRAEARNMKNQFGSVEPSIVRRGQYLVRRLVQLSELEEHYKQRADTATRNLGILEADKSVDPDEVESRQDYNTVHWNLVYQAGQRIIAWLEVRLHKLKASTLARIIGRVQRKRSRREMTFEHYVRLTGTLNGELYKRTGAKNYKAHRDRMAKLWHRHNLGERENTTPYIAEEEVLFDPSERQFGDTSISESDLIEAIDRRASATRIAAQHRVSFEEALSTLVDEIN